MNKLEEIKTICVKLLLVPFEGYARKLPDGSCEAYPDPASKLVRMSKEDRLTLSEKEIESLGQPWTIGYGSTYDENGVRVRPGEIWSHDKALYVKSKVLDKFLVDLFALSPGLSKENPYKIAAVLSWLYNCGTGNYRISTFKKKIDSKNWTEAAEQCLKWNKAQGKILRGLTLRREAEAKLLLK